MFSKPSSGVLFHCFRWLLGWENIENYTENILIYQGVFEWNGNWSVYDVPAAVNGIRIGSSWGDTFGGVVAIRCLRIGLKIPGTNILNSSESGGGTGQQRCGWWNMRYRPPYPPSWNSSRAWDNYRFAYYLYNLWTLGSVLNCNLPGFTVTRKGRFGIQSQVSGKETLSDNTPRFRWLGYRGEIYIHVKMGCCGPKIPVVPIWNPRGLVSHQISLGTWYEITHYHTPGRIIYHGWNMPCRN